MCCVCVSSVEHSTKIMKKLKLTGTAFKIFKNTAYVKALQPHRNQFAAH